MKLRAIPQVGCALLVPFTWSWLQQPFDVPAAFAQDGIFQAPDWLTATLQRLPPGKLEAAEVEALERDGAVLARGVLKEPNVLGLLSVSYISDPAAGKTLADWKYNGVMRTLVREGPLGGLAASALNTSRVVIYATNAFANFGGYPGGYTPPGPPLGGVHMDIDSSPGYVVPFVTTWLALTDAPEPLGLLRGSHRANLELDCPYGSNLTLEDGCIRRLQAASGGRLTWDALAGDVVVFFCQTYHWAVLQEKPRAALSLRWVAADHVLDFWDDVMRHSPYLRLPWWCAPMGSSPLYPLAYPRNESTVDRIWPLWHRRIDILAAQASPVLQQWLAPLLPMAWLPLPEVYGPRLCPDAPGEAEKHRTGTQ